MMRVFATVLVFCTASASASLSSVRLTGAVSTNSRFTGFNTPPIDPNVPADVKLALENLYKRIENVNNEFIKVSADLQKQMNAAIDAASKRINHINHYETGQVPCSSTDQWESNAALGTRDLAKQVTFERAFLTTPRVLVSVVYLNVDAVNNKAVRYYAFPRQIGEDGFQVVCRDYSNSVSFPSELVTWMEVYYLAFQ